jgi:para-nitrobenzyl esterase
MNRAIAAAGYIDDYRPVVDGNTLPVQPFSDDRPDSMAPDVPLIVGWCETEQRLAFSRRPERFHGTEASVRWELSRELGVSVDQVTNLLEVYRTTRPSDSFGDLHAQIAGDFSYRTTVTRIAEARDSERFAPTFLYELAWRTPVLDGLLRSPHTLCLPFVFRTADLALGITGGGNDRHRLEDEMSSAWLSFATDGVPIPKHVRAWDAYTVSERPTLVFGRETQLVPDVARDERVALNDLPAYRPAIGEGARRR